MTVSKIDPKPGELWLTRNYTKARIHSINACGQNHIHGEILGLNIRGGWSNLEIWWDEHGKFQPVEDEAYDLICKYVE